MVKDFMDVSNFSICTRCGKQRVFVRTYKETVGTSQVVHTETACPDKECQQIVEGKLLEEAQRRSQYDKSSDSKNPRNKKKTGANFTPNRFQKK